MDTVGLAVQGLPPGLELRIARGPDRRARGRAAIRAAVAALTGAEYDAIRVSASCPDCGGSDHGRPAVLLADGAGDGVDRVDVGLAHAGNRSIAVAARSLVVGVDAELVDVPAARTADVARLLGVDPGDALRQWSRIEAVLKADGRGLRVDPATVAVSNGIGRIGREPRRYDVVDLALPDLLISVATLRGTGEGRGHRASS